MFIVWEGSSFECRISWLVWSQNVNTWNADCQKRSSLVKCS